MPTPSSRAAPNGAEQQREYLIRRPWVWLLLAIVVGISVTVLTRPTLPKAVVSVRTESSPAPTNASIHIAGNERFQRQIQKALNLLVSRDPEDYLIVTQNFRVIKQGEHSGTRVGEIPSNQNW